MNSGRGWRIKLAVIGALALVAGALVPHDTIAGSRTTILAHTGPVTGPLFGDQVPPTVGAALWCAGDRREAFCKGVSAYRPLKLDDATAALISQINTDVNLEIEPLDDSIQWKVAEKWNRPMRGMDGRLQDDCDGYVIEKWYRLVEERGLPAEAFYPLYAEVPGYGGHLVLAVQTDKGTYILDNLNEEIVRLGDFKFTYLKRPRPGQRLEDTWERYLALS